MHPHATNRSLDRDAYFVLTRSIEARSGLPVIHKTVASPIDAKAGLARLTREHAVLQYLDGIDGVPQVVRLDIVRRALVVRSIPGRRLSECGLAGELAWPHLLDLSIRTLKILGAVHARGVLHLDLRPFRLWVADVQGEDAVKVTIGGFTRALLPGTDAEPIGEGALVDQLAYAAPEQTGRMNRSVDHRTDLYSFGVLLYELTCGRLPFEDQAPLSLIHAHLARVPPLAHLVRPGIPLPLSQLLARALSKEPELRFQSATEMVKELEQLRQGYTSHGYPSVGSGSRDAVGQVMGAASVESGSPLHPPFPYAHDALRGVPLDDALAIWSSHWLDRAIDAEPLVEPLCIGTEQKDDAPARGEPLRLAVAASIIACLEISDRLDTVENQIWRALRLQGRDDDDEAIASLQVISRFIQAMRGHPRENAPQIPLSPELAYSLADATAPVAVALDAVYHCLASCVLGDSAALIEHISLAERLIPALQGLYVDGLAHVAVCMALLARIDQTGHAAGNDVGDPAANAGERFALLGNLAKEISWLKARAAAQPQNFSHLLNLVVARCAEVEGRPWDAARLFEQAMTSARRHSRPWHRALILELAGHFHMKHQMESTGRALLCQALAAYERWGASAKVAQLGRTFPFLLMIKASPDGDPPRARWTSAVADRQAILTASQALASETDLGRLVPRIVEVIEQLGGATAAALFFHEEQSGWSLAGARRRGTSIDGLPIPAAAAHRHGFPDSVVRYALTIPEAETLGDVMRDPRFADDPTLVGVQRCSVLLMPIVSKGNTRAVVLLENRLTSRFFTGKDLETLGLIAGMLSTSLENALLYRLLEQRVAERTQELELASAELLLRDRALARSTNGIMICELKADSSPIIYVNAMFETITGYSSRDVLGRDPRFLQGQDLSQPGASLLSQAIAQQRTCSVILRNYRQDGTLFYNEVSIGPVSAKGGSVTHFVGAQVDVTARMELERRERRRTERLRAVFELSPDGFVVLDEDDYVSIVNPAFERMTGLMASSLIGQSAAAFEAFLAARTAPKTFLEPPEFEDGLPQDPPRPAPWMAANRQGLLRIQTPQPRTLIRRMRRGEAGGRETVFYFRDVTREMEIDQMKSDFLSTAAHELRTPMTSIYGFTELVLKRKLSDEQREDMLKTIHRQSGALITLINELLDLARIEARRGADFHYKRQLLQPIIKHTTAALIAYDDERKVQLRGLEEPRWVNVDDEKISNALTNLLSNAFKYSSKGAITIELLERQSRGRKEIGVCVSDEGIGMSPPQLARLFDRFFRVDSSGRIPGTGLGTTLAKEIVELHDGELIPQSRLGVGTQMTMWLPLQSPPADIDIARVPQQAPAADAAARKKRRKR